jgi:hypothetical protein
MVHGGIGSPFAVLRSVPQRDGRDFVFGAGVNGFGGYGKPKRALDERIAARKSAACAGPK